MRVLVVNAGSSTLKLRYLSAADELLADATIDPWDGNDAEALASFVEELDAVDAVSHRVVHGGTTMHAATVLDDMVMKSIDEWTALAPLHQPGALAAIRSAQRVLPTIPAVACFDTAYHVTLPPEIVTYALPEEWRKQWPLRRFGFHGLSHAYSARRAAALLGLEKDGLRVVTCHLGAGSSLCASKSGCSVDTTMGFSPLEGLVMQTRSGSVDPGLVLWLINVARMDPSRLAEALETKSGLAGVVGGTGDMRDVLHRCDQGDGRARLGLTLYAQRVAQGVAAMATTLRGLDALVFTAGIGEHAPEVREEITTRLEWLGIAVDPSRNAERRSDDREISLDGAGVRTLVIEAREDLEMATQTRAALRGREVRRG